MQTRVVHRLAALALSIACVSQAPGQTITHPDPAPVLQNRVYFGMRYQFTPAVAREVGYMNQFENETTEELSSNNAVVRHHGVTVRHVPARYAPTGGHEPCGVPPQ